MQNKNEKKNELSVFTYLPTVKNDPSQMKKSSYVLKLTFITAFSAVWIHIVGITVALANTGPITTVLLYISTGTWLWCSLITAPITALFAILIHISWVTLTFSRTRPRLTISITVETICRWSWNISVFFERFFSIIYTLSPFFSIWMKLGVGAFSDV